MSTGLCRHKHCPVGKQYSPGGTMPQFSVLQLLFLLLPFCNSVFPKERRVQTHSKKDDYDLIIIIFIGTHELLKDKKTRESFHHFHIIYIYSPDCHNLCKYLRDISFTVKF